jgi:hypothetical protein
MRGTGRRACSAWDGADAVRSNLGRTWLPGEGPRMREEGGGGGGRGPHRVRWLEDLCVDLAALPL